MRRWEWFEGEMGVSELDEGSLGPGRAAHLGEAYSQLTYWTKHNFLIQHFYTYIWGGNYFYTIMNTFH